MSLDAAAKSAQPHTQGDLRPNLLSAARTGKRRRLRTSFVVAQVDVNQVLLVISLFLDAFGANVARAGLALEYDGLKVSGIIV
jgi:hypothetical protein